MTHTHDNFERLSPRDYVDTKSWLAYEQNPYSTHWVRLDSCHRELSQGYNILLAITWLWANTNIRLLHDVTTPRCSKLGGCTTLPQPEQPWVVASLSAWLSSTVASMTQYLHHVVAMSLQWRRRQHDSAALLPAWLNIYITPRPSCLNSAISSRTRQQHCQHDSTAPSPAWLGSDNTQQLDHQRQRQRHVILAASRHVASSYRYYSPIYLVPGPMQASHCAAWHLHETSTFRRLVFEDFKL
jgi:hypothetical protein